VKPKDSEIAVGGNMPAMTAIAWQLFLARGNL